MKGSALGFATNTRGACHLRSLVPVEFSPYPVMTPQEAEAKFGTSEVLQFGSYKKAAALIYYQHVTVIPDLLEVCRFLFGLGAGTKTFTYDNLLELYELATGIKVDEEGNAHHRREGI